MEFSGIEDMETKENIFMNGICGIPSQIEYLKNLKNVTFLTLEKNS